MANPFRRSPYTTFSSKERREPQEMRAQSMLWSFKYMELNSDAMLFRCSSDISTEGKEKRKERKASPSFLLKKEKEKDLHLV